MVCTPVAATYAACTRCSSWLQSLNNSVLQAAVWPLLVRWRAEGSAQRSPAAGEHC